MTVQKRELLVDGIRIHVEESGEGHPLVLVHGLGGPLMWQRVQEPLSSKFRVVVVHLPGFGESESPRRRYSTEEYSMTLYELLRELNINNASIVGISYGGQIAAVFSQTYPQCVSQLILLCSTGIKEVHQIFKIAALWNVCIPLIANTVMRSETLMCFFGERSFYRIEQRPPDLCGAFFRQLSQRGKRNVWLGCLKNIVIEQEQFRRTLEILSVPTLIVWGRFDKTVPLKYGEEIRRSVKQSRLVTVEDCAHSVPLEKPEELCKVIVEFLLPQ